MKNNLHVHSDKEKNKDSLQRKTLRLLQGSTLRLGASRYGDEYAFDQKSSICDLA